ncbi:hypothetical protein SKAU_G00090800 [Synaphobranchus kaupii]|uniref:C1q domain-containing protein n=1 Tax=Synaphobranchus kaupii TaxID=118154 RepID=A0A9Q1FX42_SYNKA|nr:hypothetical protein SKAU_G00090800 [Synaphobranchus kaupii]
MSAASYVPLDLGVPLTCGNWDCNCAFNDKRSCCCVAKDLDRLVDRTYASLQELSEGIHELTVDIEEFTGERKVAFTAQWSKSGCFGPFTSNVPIPYSDISLNQGHGYNKALGAFTAPSDGLYSFSFTAYSDVGAEGARMYHQVRLMKNGEVVAAVWEDNREDSRDSATQTVLLQLQHGCQVYVELLSGRQLCSDNQKLNTFSGYLVYPGL